MTITVYGGSLSPFVRKVMVCLNEKGVEFENEPVNPFAAPGWFADISPMGKIPVLRDTAVGPDATLPDSSVICTYLERKFPDPALYPSDPFDLARALWFEEYGDTNMSVGRPFFYVLIVRRLMGQEPDHETAENTLRNELPPRFNYLDKELTGKDYFVGEKVTIADIAVASQLVNFRLAGGTVDAKQYPNLAAFTERLHSKPSFKKLIDEAQGFLDNALQ
jgi:glutathione S-transferase